MYDLLMPTSVVHGGLGVLILETELCLDPSCPAEMESAREDPDQSQTRKENWGRETEKGGYENNGRAREHLAAGHAGTRTGRAGTNIRADSHTGL
jgi:hypothetical protein